MKVLLKGSIALLFSAIFFSCTKDAAFTEDASKAQAANVPDITPVLNIAFNPDPAIANQPVTVTGSFNTTTGIPAPTCGKFQLQQMINGAWEQVAQGDVTTAVQQISYSFVPTLVGNDVYEFRLHYIKGGCAGFKGEISESFYLDVIQPCLGLTLEGSATGVPSSNAPGIYDFTITYVVKACNVDYDALKLQGGLTAASTLVEATNGFSWEVGNGPNPNSVLKWLESSQLPGGSKTYTATFRKAYSGTGSTTITGNWSVKASKNGVETAVAEFAPIVFTN